MTNHQLLNYHQQILQWQQRGDIHAYFEASKIRQFYSDFGIRIETLTAKIETLQHEYFEFEKVEDKDGKAQPDKIVLIGQGNDSKPVCLEGKTEEDFRKVYFDLLALEVGMPLKIVPANGHMKVVN
jgi:hypothetical protein